MHRRRSHRLWVLLSVLLLAAVSPRPDEPPAASPAPGSPSSSPAFLASSSAPPDSLTRPDGLVLGEPLRERAALLRRHATSGSARVWPDPSRAIARLLVAVNALAGHGLRPADHHAQALARLAEDGPGGVDPAALDLLLSDAFLSVARSLSAGFVDPRGLHPGYDRGEVIPDPLDVLEATRREGRDPAAALAALAPAHAEYEALRAALARLQAESLRATPPGDAAPRPTLPTPTAGTIDRIRLNLERWRWQPRDFGFRSVRVDIPRFGLRLVEAGRTVRTLRVVVGRPDWPTPILHSAIRELVLDPAWLVPSSIFVKEMLPQLRRDADWLDREGLELQGLVAGRWQRIDPGSLDWQRFEPDPTRWRVRQPPGPRNPLGRIKFLFPNPHDVYLHGTPGLAALELPLRVLSHGCVRVEDELAIAAFAMQPDPAWTRERIETELRDASDRRVPLPEPLPVHLLYFTAEADDAGRVTLLPDPYGWDARLLERLDAGR